MKRRSFLQNIGTAGALLPLAMGFSRVRAFAQSPQEFILARSAASSNDRITVMIRLAGGNDGLNTIVPYTNSEYYKARDADGLSIKPEDVVKLSQNSTMGFHPSLKPLEELYNEKKIAIVQNVGYPNQNLSHFRSTDIWLSGSDANVFENSGWYGKYLEEQFPNYPSELPEYPFAIELSNTLSSTLVGKNNNMGIAVTSLDYVPNAPDDADLPGAFAGDEERYVREILRQSNVFSNSIINAAVKTTQNKVAFPTTPLAQALAVISRLIASGMTTKMYIVNFGNYDTHSNQLVNQANLHAAFAGACLAFQRDLEAFGTDNKVCVMTVSEFGRRVVSNGTGTDHGSAAPILVMGSGVNGGFIGSDPNLTNLEGPGNIRMQYDFRQVYASVLGQWYGAEESEISPSALPRKFEQLPIFKAGATSVFETPGFEEYFALGQNYPNPASMSTVVPLQGVISGMSAELTVNSMDGKLLLRRSVAPGQQSVEIDTRGLPSGSYVYELQSGKLRKSKIMTVQH